MQIAPFLRMLRKTNHMTQRELAEKAGIALNTVKSIEQGRTPNPRTDTLDALLGVFNLHLFIGGKIDHE